MNDDLFEGVALDTPQNVDTSVKDEIVTEGPSPTDVEWNDYVLGLFDEKEMYDGRPLCAGLRRVAELLLGRIVVSRPTQVFPPTEGDSIGRATVIWEVVFEDGSVFSDVADCWEGNTDDTFCVFNTATAATRAEARALRKALRLRGVAAEEITKKNTAQIVRDISKSQGVDKSGGEYEDSARMSDAQRNFIGVKCRQLNVNATSLFQEVMKIKGKITKKVASEAIEVLNSYQRETGTIPTNILGYVEEWQ